MRYYQVGTDIYETEGVMFSADRVVFNPGGWVVFYQFADEIVLALPSNGYFFSEVTEDEYKAAREKTNE